MPELRIIHIVRSDLPALYGSAYQGRKSGIMHSWYKGHGDRAVDRLRIRRRPFTAFALASLRAAQAVRELSRSHAYLEIAYEDYLRDPAAVQNALFRFVDVPVVPAAWVRSAKVLPPASDYISNYEEATRWSHELAAYVLGGTRDRALERDAAIGRIISRLERLLQ
jgi:hypothetical protein